MLDMLRMQLQHHPQHRLIKILGSVFIILFFLMGARLYNSILLKHHTNKQALPTVNTITAKLAPFEEEIVLPASIAAWHEAPIYARTNGYVKQWNVDIGDKVKTGDILAIIETPELDDQLRQAEADLKVAIARNDLAQVTAIRWKKLLKTESVSKQETDEKVDTARATKAAVVAAKANRDRLRDLVSFEQLTAPFSGTISSRATDIGALINAGNQPNAKPLFRLVQTDQLRIYVKIPENYASRIKPNMTVRLTLNEYPGQFFQAKLFQTAGAIDPMTRTILAQFTISNKDGKLLPGSYTQMHFTMPIPANSVLLPINALIFQAQGLQVATLNKHDQVVLKPITIHRDFGKVVEIDTGIQPGEIIIINPEDDIMNGQQVRVAKK
jgi:RND family efflux transporter MFP subunit